MTMRYDEVMSNIVMGPKQFVRVNSTGDGFETYTTTDTATKTFTTPTRSLNTAFQISSSQDAAVNYAVDISCTMSLTSGQTGVVTLQYADDSGFTTGVTTVQSTASGNTGTLTIGLTLTQIGTAAVSGIIPAGKYVKLATANTTGTPTFTYRNAQEVLL
jgi:secreted Zn-dependent insulinase-like peptidase